MRKLNSAPNETPNLGGRTMANENVDKGITFDIPQQQLDALQKIAGSRKINILGEIKDGKFYINNVGFASSNQAFAACNAGPDPVGH